MAQKFEEATDKISEQVVDQKLKLKVGRKISQLQNKAYFFEGQLNPISVENKRLKDQLIVLNKAVSFSTQLLRNLLPVEHTSERKLKLEMATIQQISTMIRQEWETMSQQIEKLRYLFTEKQQEYQTLHHIYKQTIQKYEKNITQLIETQQKQIQFRDNKIIQLDERVVYIKQQAEREKQKIKNRFKQQIAQAQKIQKAYRKLQHEMKEQQRNSEKRINKLKEENQSNLDQFEKSKETLKQIYSKIMDEKLLQQKQGYDFLIKNKEDDILGLMNELNQTHKQYKEKIISKNTQLNNLSGANEKLKEQIGNYQGQIWEQKLKIDKFIKSVEELKNEIKDNQFINQSLKKELIGQRELCEKQKSYMRKQKQQAELLLNQVINKQRQLNIKNEKQKKRLAEELEANSLKNQQYLRKLRENEDDFKRSLQSEKSKFNKIIEQKENLISKVQSQLLLEQKKKQQVQKEFLEKNEMYENKIKLISHEFQQEKEAIKRFSEKKMRQINQLHTEEMYSIQKEYSRKISEMQIGNNDYIRNLIKSQNQKLHQKEQRWRIFQEKVENEIETQKKSLEKMILEKKSLEEAYQQNKKQLLQQKQIYEKQIVQQKSAYEKIIQEEKATLLNQMKQQIMDFQKVLNEKEVSYAQKISQMKSEMMSQIELLRKSNCVEELEDKYLEEMRKIRAEASEREKKINEENEKLLKEKNQFFEDQLSKQQKLFNENLHEISTKLQFDITKLNQELLQQKQSHQFTKLKREQKIKFLFQKIGIIKKDVEKKDEQISELQVVLDQKNQQLGQIDLIIEKKIKDVEKKYQREIEEMEQEYLEKIKNMQAEARIRFNQFERQKINYTNELYMQFGELTKAHRQEINYHIDKYNELERIFEERPSRLQDLTKIKELIEAKNKMDSDMKKCKKDVSEANQIVKYLNLQLQNYKNVYDIFGPGGDPLSPERKNLSTEGNVSPYKEHLKRLQVETPPSSEFSSFRRMNTEQQNPRQQFRIFPALKQKRSYTFNQEEEIKPKQDKSKELKSNASIFISLLKDEHPPVVDFKQKKSYSKRYLGRSKKKNGSIIINKERQYIIKQSSSILEKIN